MTDSHDSFFLNKALELAMIRRGFCAPNPSVGAVIVRHGEIIASGYHHGPGSAHAEIDALNKIQNTDVNDATMYVTLEPCCHFGRTPPCTDALIQRGLRRIVYGFKDPNQQVAGKGHQALVAAGINIQHVFTQEITAFYKSYAHWQLTQKPFLTAKIALSMDGKIASQDGTPIQITGVDLRDFTHQCRKETDAILSTAKTMINDDPQLNARVSNTLIAKHLYILDSNLSLPVTAKIFTTAQSVTIFYRENASPKLKAQLTNKGARCIPISHTDQGLALNEVITFLGSEGHHDVWVEAGGTCFSALVNQQLLQRAYIYMAPIWLGNGLNAFNADFNLKVSDQHLEWRQYGKDVLCEIHW